MYFIYRSAAWAKSVSSGDSNYPTAAILLALASQDGTRICVTDRCGTRQAFGSGACVYLEQNPEGWSVGNASHFSVGAHYSFFLLDLLSARLCYWSIIPHFVVCLDTETDMKCSIILYSTYQYFSRIV